VRIRTRPWSSWVRSRKRELVNTADAFPDDRRNLLLQARIIAQYVARRTTQNGRAAEHVREVLNNLIYPVFIP
jgi:hypothetical protein